MNSTRLDSDSSGVTTSPPPALNISITMPEEGARRLATSRRARLAGLVFSWLCAASLVILIIYPLATILIQSILPDLFSVPARVVFSLDPLQRAFGTREVYLAMINTAWLGLAVALSSTLIGTVLAILFLRTDLPWRGLFDKLVWITLFTPSYLVALAWELLFSRGGFIDILIAPLPDGVINTIFSPVGLTVILSLRLFPFSYLAVGAALRGLGSEYEDAARMVGARPLRRWARINAPLLLPAIVAGGLIVFAEAISDYGTAATIAQQAGFNLVTYELYAAINNEPVDFALAAALALILVAAIAAALLVQARLLRARSYQIITGRTRRAQPLPLNTWRIPVLILSIIFFVAALLLPLLATILMSFMRNLGNGLVSSNISLVNYQLVMDLGGDALPAIERSTFLALATATITALLGAAVAFVIERTRLRGRGLLRLTTIVSIAIPGVVLAAGYIFAWNQPWMNTVFGGTPYGTLGLLLAAYVAGSLPFSARLAGGALAQIDEHLLEAGRLAGAGTLGIFLRIILPVIASALLSTWTLIFTGTMFELPASELLQPPGQPPLAVQIIGQYNNFKQGPGTAMTILALLVVAVAAFVIAGLTRLIRRQRGGSLVSRSL